MSREMVPLMDGEDAPGYALAVNINRRHLSKGQRAMAVAKVYPEPSAHSSLGSKIEPNTVHKGTLSQARTVLRRRRRSLSKSHRNFGLGQVLVV
jgi:hypothetical protein